MSDEFDANYWSYLEEEESDDKSDWLSYPWNSHDKLMARGMETIKSIIGEDNYTLEDGITPNTVMFVPAHFAVKDDPDGRT